MDHDVGRASLHAHRNAIFQLLLPGGERHERHRRVIRSSHLLDRGQGGLVETAIGVQHEGREADTKRRGHGPVAVVLLSTASIAHGLHATISGRSAPACGTRVADGDIRQQAALGQVELDVRTAGVVLAQVVGLDARGYLEHRCSVGKQAHHSVVARVDGGPRARDAQQSVPAVSGCRLSMLAGWSRRAVRSAGHTQAQLHRRLPLQIG